jgi:hypothetical protein
MAWREQVQGDRTLAQCLWHAMDIAALNPSYELQRGAVGRVERSDTHHRSD